MNDLELYLVIVLGSFLAVILLLYTCLKIFQRTRKRNSRHYSHVLREGEGIIETSGDNVMITMPPIKPHLFARSYRFNSQDYEEPGNYPQRKKHDAPVIERQPQEAHISANCTTAV